MRVIFLIRSLESGGAERQLVILAANLARQGFSVSVVTYYGGGQLESELQGIAGVRVMSAGKRGRWDVAGFIWRLWKLVREVRPDVIHGYMYGANELALLLGFAGHARVVWGVRASGLEMQRYDWTTRLLQWTGARLSSQADAVISNSHAGRRFHIELGYPSQRFLVIPNGVDTDVYKLDDVGRHNIRSQWQVSTDEVLIGIVARVDPLKDHDTFLHAAAALESGGVPVRFVIVGPGTKQNLLRLKAVADQLGVGHRVIWAGPRQDMPLVYSAIDIVTSTSLSEGFSNSLAEAMACERTCVATDVGDAGLILGEFGQLVPPRSPQALARAWLKVLEERAEHRAARGIQARIRIAENFSVRALAARTGDVLMRVAAGARSLTSNTD